MSPPQNSGLLALNLVAQCDIFFCQWQWKHYSNYCQTYKIGNDGKGIRGFTKRTQQEIQQNCYLQWELNLASLRFRSNTLHSELVWHIFVRGSLNCLLSLHHLILGLRWSVWTWQNSYTEELHMRPFQGVSGLKHSVNYITFIMFPCMHNLDKS